MFTMWDIGKIPYKQEMFLLVNQGFTSLQKAWEYAWRMI